MARIEGWDPVTEYLEDQGVEGAIACELLAQEGDAQDRYEYLMRKARIISEAVAYFARCHARCA
jgi:hypothetical protein